MVKGKSFFFLFFSEGMKKLVERYRKCIAVQKEGVWGCVCVGYQAMLKNATYAFVLDQ